MIFSLIKDKTNLLINMSEKEKELHQKNDFCIE